MPRLILKTETHEFRGIISHSDILPMWISANFNDCGIQKFDYYVDAIILSFFVQVKLIFMLCHIKIMTVLEGPVVQEGINKSH